MLLDEVADLGAQADTTVTTVEDHSWQLGELLVMTADNAGDAGRATGAPDGDGGSVAGLDCSSGGEGDDGE